MHYALVALTVLAACGQPKSTRHKDVRSGIDQPRTADSTPVVLPATYMRSMVPDLTQTALVGVETGDGQQYCAPVAAANALMWLARNGVNNLVDETADPVQTQIHLAKLLGAADMMDTNLTVGTSPTQVMRGLRRYFANRNIPVAVTFEGWRDVAGGFYPARREPQLQTLEQGLVGQGVVLLNVGWYVQSSDKTYVRQSGHWLTLVGYDRSSGTAAETLIVHDPSPRAGAAAAAHTLVLKKLTKGQLDGKHAGLPRAAAGYFAVAGDLKLPSGSDTAILDSIVVVTPK